MVRSHFSLQDVKLHCCFAATQNRCTKWPGSVRQPAQGGSVVEDLSPYTCTLVEPMDAAETLNRNVLGETHEIVRNPKLSVVLELPLSEQSWVDLNGHVTSFLEPFGFTPRSPNLAFRRLKEAMYVAIAVLFTETKRIHDRIIILKVCEMPHGGNLFGIEHEMCDVNNVQER